MRALALVACMSFLAGMASGDPNRLPQDDAQRYAKLCIEQVGNLPDAQVAMEVDPEKPCAVQGEGGGAMAIPDKKLAEAAILKAGKDVVPVGQLWLRKWTPVAGGKAVPDDRLRIVTVKIDEKDRPMPLLLLGVRKKAEKSDLEVVVYAKGAEPLLVLPLKKVETNSDLPVEVAWTRGDKDADALTVSVLGKWQVTMGVARQGK